jgi:polyisoprenoid-binding protein YceI
MNMFSNKVVWIFVILLAIILAACGSTQTSQPDSAPSVEQPIQTEEVAAASNENTFTTGNDNQSMENSIEDIAIQNSNDNEDMDDSNENETMDDSNANESMEDNQNTTSSNDQPATSGAVTLVILPEESEARFIIDEILNGADKQVVGVTNAVEGSITADQADPGSVSVSPIKVDLSNLTTDNSFRNRAIKDLILQTGDPVNQFATFEPTGYSGLPETITIGEPFSFQITGDLTIHGVTNQETFDVTATPVSETRLEGTATLADLTYADYGVKILRLPAQVASVEDTVTLELFFVAVVP